MIKPKDYYNTRHDMQKKRKIKVSMADCLLCEVSGFISKRFLHIQDIE